MRNKTNLVGVGHGRERLLELADGLLGNRVRGGRCGGLSMIRRRIAAFFVAFFLCVTLVHAALPALALVIVEEALDFAAGLVIREAGKQVVATVGVAANDASWLSTASSMVPGIAAMLGIAVATTAGSERYLVPTKEGVTIPGSVVTPSGDLGTYSNPLAWNAAGIVPRVTDNGTFCKLAAWESVDGVARTMPIKTYASWDEMIEACRAIRASRIGAASYVPPHYVSSGGDPYELLIGSNTYYVQAVDVVIDEEVSSPGTGYGHSLGYHFGAIVIEAVDGVRRFVICGAGFCPDAADPDWSAADKARFSGPSQLVFKGLAHDGSAVRVDVAYDPSLGLKLQSLTQAAPNQVKLRSLVMPSSSSPSQVSESLVNNAQVATFYETNPASGLNGGSGNTITFPDDYARQGTLQSVDSGVSTLHKDLTDTSNVDDPTIPDQSRFAESFFSGTFDGLKGWSLPGHVSQCPTGSFVWNSTSYTIDAHCQLVNDHFNALQAAMAVVWSLLALFIVLKA